MSRSSVATAIPSGVIKEWCVQSLLDFDDGPTKCANATRGTTNADFETFCCDGMILDTTQNLYTWGGGDRSVDLRNLICCGVEGPQAGGLQPIQSDAATRCTEGSPTPLASLAATNTKNAVPYLVTYTSASYGDTTTGDFIPTKTPYCLWADTAHGIPMTTITVEAAQITTLPAATTDEFGYPISTSIAFGGTIPSTAEVSTAVTSVAAGTTPVAGSSTTTSTSGGSSNRALPLKAWMVLGLGILAFS